MAASLAVVIPHLETYAETLACLASLRGSRRRPEWILVVDNGSRDGSGERLAKEPGVELLRVERNLGFGGGCNLGIARALALGAARILLLNSDAELTPDCLSRLEEALDRGGAGLGIVAPAILRRGSPPRVDSLGIRFSPLTGRMRNLGAGRPFVAPPAGAEPLAVERDGVIGCALLARSEVFTRAGTLRAELIYGYEDLELCLRAGRAGLRSACVPSAVVWHGGAHTIGSRSPDRLYFGARNQLLVARLSLPLPPLAAALRFCAVVGFNLAQALLRPPAPRVSGVAAVLEGVFDHLRGRYGFRRG